ncbi:hypothetical protein ACOSP7_007932 [Xanthoceras sorbifolium]
MAVKRLNLVLRILKQSKWRLSSIFCGSVTAKSTTFSERRSWSFDYLYIGLHCTEDEESGESSSVRELQRTRSFTSYYSCSDGDDNDDDDDDDGDDNDDDDDDDDVDDVDDDDDVDDVDDDDADIDERAEIFIFNFRRHLWYERPISLQRRYGRVYSFD